MLGKRSDQMGLREADRLYLDHVGKDTFYGLLASLRGQLFSDDDFAEIYCPDNGRDSVPPSLLATALLLQTYDRVSDAEAKARADFDIRWKVALGIEIEDRPFAKSTLQMFRAQLILHDQVREVFESSLRLARESGYLWYGHPVPAHGLLPPPSNLAPAAIARATFPAPGASAPGTFAAAPQPRPCPTAPAAPPSPPCPQQPPLGLLGPFRPFSTAPILPRTHGGFTLASV